MRNMTNASYSLLVAAFMLLSLSACDDRTTDLPSGVGSLNGDNVHFQEIEVTTEVVRKLRLEALTPTPDRLSESATDAAEPYRLGFGDEVQVRIWTPRLKSYAGRSEWSENPPLPVRADGNITIPLAGDIKVAGKTLIEARATMDEALGAYYKNFQSRMEVTRYGSQEAYIFGAVKQPGPIALKDRPISVLRAVAEAGGATELADLTRAELFHADGTKDVLNLSSAIQGGKSAASRIYLRDGDRLTLATTNGNRAFVLGEVKKPQLVTLRMGSVSVMEMLTSADGLEKSGSYSHVYLIRGAIDSSLANSGADDATIAATIAAQKADPMTTTVYRMNLTSAQGLALAGQLPVQPMDIVYVSPTAISRWSDFINGIFPLSSVLLLNAAVNYD